MDTPHEENGPLSCPFCGCDYLHMDGVEVFRASADADKGVEVTVQGVEVRITPDPSSTPVAWGNGVQITFFCEWCPTPVVLSLTGHDGQTIQIWERGDAPPDPDEKEDAG